ncbi:MAG: NAD(P)/FAD-dependent oxidoreductase [Candidatus Tectimicrobiota bacterium]
MEQHKQRVVICGAGVIGAAVAYYLALRGVATTLVERCDVACAASGKAGGFLALDWCDGSPLAPLARTSFHLHAQLAQTLGLDYGYRRLTTLGLAADVREPRQPRRLPAELAWLDGQGVPYSRLGTPDTTAQVHPAQFTRALLQAAQARGARVHLGCVEGLDIAHGGVRGVQVSGQVIPADVVVIAMGPWSGLAAQWLPLPPVWGLKGHSITVRPSTPIPAQALFVDYITPTGERLAPEVYPRPDGEIYLCGVSEEAHLPEDPAQVQVRPEAGALLQQIAGSLSSSLADLPLHRAQACYRPVTADGLPLLGAVPEVSGAYIATGHSCWGILNAPASGLALAELIVDGHASSVDLAPFAPQRALAQH